MAKQTIFHGLAKNENSYTQLLRNLLVRDDAFREAFLSIFLSEDQAKSVLAAHVHSQCKLENGGRPDILIQTSSSCLIIEVKTESLTGRTPRQALKSTSDDDPTTYLRHLQSRSLNGFDTCLVFLVPPAWKHWHDLEHEIEEITRDGAKNAVSVKQFSWTELLSRLRSADKVVGAAFVEDFCNLIEDKFGTITFVRDEIDSMAQDKLSLATALKITGLIEEIRKRAGKIAVVTDMVITREELGFFFKKDKKWILYFGCWPSSDNETPRTLCFGVDDPSEEVRKAFVESFEAVYGHVATLRDKWIMGWVPNEDLETADATSAVWEKLEQLWNAVATASE